MYKKKPKLQQQFDAIDRDKIKWAVIIGENEIEKGVVSIKDMSPLINNEKRPQTLIERGSVVEWLKEKISAKF